MTTHLHFEDAFTSIFRTVVESIGSIKKEFVDTILMNLIVTIQNKNKALSDMFFEIQENPKILLNMDLDDFYDTMLQLEDNFKPLLKLAKINKEKSDMFMQFYKAIDKIYGTVVYVNIEVGFLEAELKHPYEIENAS